MEPLRQYPSILDPGTLPDVDMRMPIHRRSGPLGDLGRRVLLGIALVVAVTLITYLGRAGYTDNHDGIITLVDAFYYATVAVTTTGYGDITAVSQSARLVTALLVTPIRVVFLVLLVGTSVELIATATRSILRERTWRKRVKDHVVICGFGVKGREALASLHQQGYVGDRVVVIDPSEEEVRIAGRRGCVGIVGDATRNAILEAACVERARTVIIVPDRDDTSVLTTLSARSLNPAARIVASVRELENAPLVRQSGADVVLTSSGATGRMLGLAALTLHLASVIEELLEIGHGFDLVERTIEVSGRVMSHKREDELVIAVFRGDELVKRNPAGDFEINAGDQLVSIATGLTNR